MIKNVFARLFIMTNDVRFTASSFHFIERPQFFSISRSQPLVRCALKEPWKDKNSHAKQKTDQLPSNTPQK
jgi:hypothetical protein